MVIGFFFLGGWLTKIQSPLCKLQAGSENRSPGDVGVSQNEGYRLYNIGFRGLPKIRVALLHFRQGSKMRGTRANVISSLQSLSFLP